MLLVASAAAVVATAQYVSMDKLRWLVDAYVCLTPEHRAAVDLVIRTLAAGSGESVAIQPQPASSPRPAALAILRPVAATEEAQQA